MGNQQNEDKELSGNWRGKAYNLRGMNPFHGVRVGVEEDSVPEKLVVELPEISQAEVEAAMQQAQKVIANAFRYDPTESVETLQVGSPPEKETFRNRFAEFDPKIGSIRPEDVPSISVKATMQLDEVGDRTETSIDLEKLRETVPQSIKDMSWLGDMEEPKEPWEEELTEVLEEALNLFLRKNRQYGNSIIRTGALGAVTALTGDVARLRKLVLRTGGTIEQEEISNVRDKFLDVLVQAAIGIMMLDKNNIVGED